MGSMESQGCKSALRLRSSFARCLRGETLRGKTKCSEKVNAARRPSPIAGVHGLCAAALPCAASPLLWSSRGAAAPHSSPRKGDLNLGRASHAYAPRVVQRERKALRRTSSGRRSAMARRGSSRDGRTMMAASTRIERPQQVPVARPRSSYRTAAQGPPMMLRQAPPARPFRRAHCGTQKSAGSLWCAPHPAAGGYRSRVYSPGGARWCPVVPGGG
jgi:hypothetical protein